MAGAPAVLFVTRFGLSWFQPHSLAVTRQVDLARQVDSNLKIFPQWLKVWWVKLAMIYDCHIGKSVFNGYPQIHEKKFIETVQ